MGCGRASRSKMEMRCLGMPESCSKKLGEKTCIGEGEYLGWMSTEYFSDNAIDLPAMFDVPPEG